MSCKIKTGRKEVSVRASRSENGDVEYSYLFDHKSTNTISRPIHIYDCEAKKLSTFNLPDGVKLTVHRVIVGGGVMPQGSGCLCAGEPGQQVKVLMSEPLKIECKPVVLDNCNSVLFLTIPGSYVLELSDESVLGNFLAMEDSVECCCLPDGLIIGNVGPTGYVGVK